MYPLVPDNSNVYYALFREYLPGITRSGAAHANRASRAEGTADPAAGSAAYTAQASPSVSSSDGSYLEEKSRAARAANTEKNFFVDERSGCEAAGACA